LVIWDLFPEYAVKAGVIRNKRVISALEWLEKLFYRHAAHLSVISIGFRTKLIERGVPSDKLTVIPVWADPDEISPLPKQTSFRQQYGWQDKFIVLYTGNLGLTCALEDALETADILKIYSDIHFVIVGEGVKKNKLLQTANSKNLPNVTFLPFQPRQKFPELLATADATLVTLNENSQSTSMPSKTFSYLAASRPILAVAPLQSDLSQIIASSNTGLCISPGKPEELANAILRLKSDQIESEEMGLNGRHLLKDQFSREHCVDMYENMFKKFAKTK
jgi:colanic acid biosynthesis glycosyl transferase WcaI